MVARRMLHDTIGRGVDLKGLSTVNIVACELLLRGSKAGETTHDLGNVIHWLSLSWWETTHDGL